MIEKQSDLTIRTTILLIIIVLAIIPFFFIDFNKPIQESKEDIAKRAASVSQTFVANYLKAPATAEFPYYGSVPVKTIRDYTYEVHSYVDSENSFGAKIRTRYKCTIKYDPTDKDKEWKLLNLKFDP